MSAATQDGTSDFKQTLYKASHLPISITSLGEDLLTQEVLNKFAEHSTIGLAGEYKSGHLTRLVLATSRRALHIRIASQKASGKRLKRIILSQLILLNQKVTLIAYNFDRLALALHCDMGLRINNGVDFLSLSSPPGGEKVTRTSMQAVANVLGRSEVHGLSRVAYIFQDEKEIRKRLDSATLRAWSACYVASLPKSTPLLSQAPRLDTMEFEKKHLDLLAMLIRVSFKIEALKPSFTKNDISEDIFFRKGKLQLVATRYKTKPRASDSQSHRLELKNNTSQKGRVVKVKGRNIFISTNKGLRPSDISGITTIGKDEPTSAESLKAKIILGTLQRTISLFQNPVILSFWFRGMHTSSFPTAFVSPSERPRGITVPLNPPQLSAVRSMLLPCPLNGDVQVTTIHGPPGSGKTSVVAGFVEAIKGLSHKEYGEAVYLVAQSNFAVKNMAEKLAKINFKPWKLIVSRDFHFDWHEHLYNTIQSKVIESSRLPETDLEVERTFRGVRVILCTLSMFSSERLAKIGLTRIFPPRTMVVDEASQIELGDYLPVFHTFRRTLRRMCFVGDDKQLAPYGQEDIGEIQSVFEIPEIRNGAIFLDTQYRMPTPIGAFISQNVYGGRLKSSHSNNNKASCRWVDVHNGVEATEGRSWKNEREIQVVVHLVRQAVTKGEDFRVITPYDAQRNELERALKAAGLPWEDRCYNVDSFQGNEADHIIVSIVRTKKPGFLTNERRTNVMLTRCKKKMTICTNRTFLESHRDARKTLVGRMAATWGPNFWISGNDVINRRSN